MPLRLSTVGKPANDMHLRRLAQHGGEHWFFMGTEDSRDVSDGMYLSEKIIGRWLRDRGCRNAVETVTKVSNKESPEHIRRSVQGSLERMGTDSVAITCRPLAGVFLSGKGMDFGVKASWR